MPGREEPVGEWEAKVVVVQLDESRFQLLRKVHALGKGVGLEFKAATQGCQHEGQQLQKKQQQKSAIAIATLNHNTMY